MTKTIRLQDLFYGKIGVTNRYYVEFGGACGVPGSKTFRLRRNRASLILPQYRSQHVAWKGFMMDGEACKLRRGSLVHHQAWIDSDSIIALFDKYGVPAEPDYVSIDLDSVDLWVLRALLSTHSRFRPRVLTVEVRSHARAALAIASLPRGLLTHLCPPRRRSTTPTLTRARPSPAPIRSRWPCST